MKTISDYSIYCTEEQTKKARELGAPIEVKSIEEAPNDWQGKAFFTGMSTCAKLPTTEQLVGWLEEQGKIRDIGVYKSHILWTFDICNEDADVIAGPFCYYSSRKEATLAAIDAALEYLTNNRK